MEYAKAIKAKTELSFTDEAFIDEAIAALKATKSNALDYGYTEDEWNELVSAVEQAKRTLLERHNGSVEPEPEPEGSAVGAIVVVVIVIVLGAAIIAFVVLTNKKDGIKPASPDKQEEAHAESASEEIPAEEVSTEEAPAEKPEEEKEQKTDDKAVPSEGKKTAKKTTPKKSGTSKKEGNK